jgi:peptidoglycan/xylan/chitin deacetylase (PgdA/CDA1 family)
VAVAVGAFHNRRYEVGYALAISKFHKMFFEANRQKIIFMSGIALAIFILIVASFFLNRHFFIMKNVEIFFLRSRSSFTYMFEKIRMDQNPDGRAFAFNLAGAGAVARNIFGEEEYYNSNLDNNESAKSVPVLTYHGIPSEGEGNVPYDRFVSQMHAMKRSGWRTITLEEFESFVRGDAELPARSFLLTFDDGRKDTYYPVDPVLKDLGYNAVMFVITGQSLRQDPTQESEYYLSEIELDKMIKSGRWQLESHGRRDHNIYAVDEAGTPGHFLSNKFWVAEIGRLETEDEFRSRIVTDLEGSKLDLEFIFGTEVRAFAFPFGDYGQGSVNFKESIEIVEEAVRANYVLAFYQPDRSMGDSFNYPENNPFMIKRLEPSPEWTTEMFMSVINSRMTKPLPYEAREFGIDWKGSWGDVKLGEGMVLAAEESTVGAAVALEGSYSWQNYEFEANIDWRSGDDVLLVGRYKNNDNYFACDYSDSKVTLKQRINGETQTISAGNYSTFIPRNNVNLGMQVSGNTAACLFNGSQVTRSAVSAELPNGGIGIHIWDRAPGVADITVNSVSVTEI